MDISLETTIDHLREWKASTCSLNVAVGGQGLRVFSRATVTAVSANMVVFAFSEAGNGLSILLHTAKRFRSFLPSDPPPPDVGGYHKACLLFLVITLQDDSLCKICELSDHADFPVIRFGILSP
jgi:hypothetical protein